MSPTLQVTKNSYTVLDFLEWQRQGTLDLRPFYQRRAVWNPRVKSLLLDSIIRGFPIPLIFLHNRLDVRSSRSVRQVVDGQQRLRTILSFVDPDSVTDRGEWDDFTILRAHNKEFADTRFVDLPSEVQSQILQTSLSVNVLPPDIADVTVLQIFQRMNTTGIKLTDQEIRNGTFFGEFKDLSYGLAYEQNQRWLEWGIFTQQEIAQMQEVEFTSDLLGALIRGVSGRSASQITALYKEFDDSLPNRDALSEQFREGIEALAAVYDGREVEPASRRFRSTSWLYPLFAVVAGLDDAGSDPRNDLTTGLPATTWHEPVTEARALAAALAEVDRLVSTRGALPDELSESLRRQTTHKASRLQRIRLIRSVLGHV